MFRDLDLSIAYETNDQMQHLLEYFYIPVLEQSDTYYRVAGYFSSTALVVAAEGIEALINNSGKMCLLVSPELSEDDLNIIKTYGTLTEEASPFKHFSLQDNRDENLQALAYLLDCGHLEIKVVVPRRGNTSIFHEKVGIFFDKDSGDIISFSGSINETAQAWLYNIEEFKVFRSWVNGQKDYVLSDLNKFLKYWKNTNTEIANVYDIPDAVKEKILQIKPRDIRDLNIMRRYERNKKIGKTKFRPFTHQEKAIQMWVNNNCHLLMEMATGTGKTRTAIGCLLEKIKDGETILAIISTPQNTLSRQWKTDFEELEIKLDQYLIVDGTNSKWKRDLEMLLMDLEDGLIKTAAIFTTHKTASSDTFISIIRRTKKNTKILYIGDEVHAAGSAQQKRGLLPEYEYRIGLSATPERMFDELGTNLIRSYFGRKSFEFTIYDALHTINPATGKYFLNNYYYNPIFLTLSENEHDKYKEYSKKIAIELNKENPDQEKLRKLYERRANICKNAENKYEVLENLLDEMKVEHIVDTILFCSDKQIKKCLELTGERKIKRAEITESESASKIVNENNETERQKLIHDFKDHHLQMLLAIKCLDEGIDIRTARVAILMSSGTNPREYIQRVGRVIREAPGKAPSEIYDFIVYDPENVNILEREAKRANIIAENAMNYSDVRNLFLEHGVTLNAD